MHFRTKKSGLPPRKMGFRGPRTFIFERKTKKNKKKQKQKKKSKKAKKRKCQYYVGFIDTFWMACSSSWLPKTEQNPKHQKNGKTWFSHMLILTTPLMKFDVVGNFEFKNWKKSKKKELKFELWRSMRMSCKRAVRDPNESWATLSDTHGEGEGRGKPLPRS